MAIPQYLPPSSPAKSNSSLADVPVNSLVQEELNLWSLLNSFITQEDESHIINLYAPNTSLESCQESLEHLNSFAQKLRESKQCNVEQLESLTLLEEKLNTRLSIVKQFSVAADVLTPSSKIQTSPKVTVIQKPQNQSGISLERFRSFVHKVLSAIKFFILGKQSTTSQSKAISNDTSFVTAVKPASPEKSEYDSWVELTPFVTEEATSHITTVCNSEATLDQLEESVYSLHAWVESHYNEDGFIACQYKTDISQELSFDKVKSNLESRKKTIEQLRFLQAFLKSPKEFNLVQVEQTLQQLSSPFENLQHLIANTSLLVTLQSNTPAETSELSKWAELISFISREARPHIANLYNSKITLDELEESIHFLHTWIESHYNEDGFIDSQYTLGASQEFCFDEIKSNLENRKETIEQLRFLQAFLKSPKEFDLVQLGQTLQQLNSPFENLKHLIANISLLVTLQSNTPTETSELSKWAELTSFISREARPHIANLYNPEASLDQLEESIHFLHTWIESQYNENGFIDSQHGIGFSQEVFVDEIKSSLEERMAMLQQLKLCSSSKDFINSDTFDINAYQQHLEETKKILDSMGGQFANIQIIANAISAQLQSTLVTLIALNSFHTIINNAPPLALLFYIIEKTEDILKNESSNEWIPSHCLTFAKRIQLAAEEKIEPLKTLNKALQNVQNSLNPRNGESNYDYLSRYEQVLDNALSSIRSLKVDHERSQSKILQATQQLEFASEQVQCLLEIEYTLQSNPSVNNLLFMQEVMKELSERTTSDTWTSNPWIPSSYLSMKDRLARQVEDTMVKYRAPVEETIHFFEENASKLFRDKNLFQSIQKSIEQVQELFLNTFKVKLDESEFSSNLKKVSELSIICEKIARYHGKDLARRDTIYLDLIDFSAKVEHTQDILNKIINRWMAELSSNKGQLTRLLSNIDKSKTSSEVVKEFRQICEAITIIQEGPEDLKYLNKAHMHLLNIPGHYLSSILEKLKQDLVTQIEALGFEL